MRTVDVVTALSALAHETRLEVFRRLVKAGPDGLPAGTIAEELRVPASTLSFHLKELRVAGVVRLKRDGRNRLYAADYDAMGALLSFLTEECCRGATVDPETSPTHV